MNPLGNLLMIPSEYIYLLEDNAYALLYLAESNLGKVQTVPINLWRF
jgi:hypothetical protein